MPRRSRSIQRSAAAVMAALVVGIATGACSLFVSTDGLTANGEADASDEAAIDASNDVVIVDAQVDAREENAIDGAPLPFCVTNASALFCDDFDDGAVGSKWDSQQTADGTISVDAKQFRSSPYSALFVADGNASVVTLNKSIPASSGSYRVAFALRVDTAPASSPGSPYQILMRIDNGKNAILELFEDSGGFSVNDRINGSFGTSYSTVAGITVGTWVDVVFHVRFGASGGTSSASIDINGMNVVPTFDIASAFNAPSGVGLGVGIDFGSGSSTVVDVDNVAISAE